MAQYKVPQDVEADDKLLGPFSFRQLVYLFIAGGIGTLAFGLFQIFPLLAVIPLPFILFFLILALPLKKDQPMETYLAALISFYLKPNKRFWNPGQRESTITIIAPKKIEGPRIRNLSDEEASRRLSFLAEVIDSEGKSITGNWNGAVKDEYVAEASATPDMFEDSNINQLNLDHEKKIAEMRAAIEKTENLNNLSQPPQISHTYSTPAGSSAFTVTATTPLPSQPIVQPLPSQLQSQPQSQPQESEPQNPAKIAAMQELANNPDFSIATIAKEANRIQNDNNNEVYISLH